ncbi:MAG: elongation factor G [candidate division NC10 bacterium]|nr:elongation factor G [candidate division NC10 bacterium]
MKGAEVAPVRNVGIVGHAQEGKTSLVEAILFDTGVVSRLGRVEEGNTTTDFDEDEIKRRISISAAVAFTEWKGVKFNLIDTPGFSNFLSDTRTCMRVTDAALILVSAVDGVKVQTGKVWGYAEEYGLPVFFFANRMDRERADPFRALADIRKGLHPAAVLVQIPIGAEAGFRGVVDLVAMKAYTYQTDGSGKFKEEGVPSELKERAEKFHHALVEAVAESDDALLEQYLASGGLTTEDLRQGLRRAIAGRRLFPVLCGSATRNVGVQPLLDLLIECSPSPVDRPPVEGSDAKSGQRVVRAPRLEEPLTALVFKTISDPYAGKISVFRVYAGQLNADSFVYNATKQVKERIGQISLLRGRQQTPVAKVGAGDIGSVVKLKETGTGDTLCDEKSPVLLDPLPVSTPLISYAVAPKSKGDEEKLSGALSRLLEEDPSLKLGRDQQTRETIISGMGKVHLEVAVERLRRKFGVEVFMKTPRVPYKETIRGMASVQGKYKKQTGGRGQYGDCWIKVEPLPRGKGFEFVNQVVGGVIPRQYIPAVEKGIVEAMEGGILAGYPVTDVKVSLYDGSYHTVDSSEMSFKIAGSLAVKKGVQQATPVLLEPIMVVEVSAPDDAIGDVIGDLNSRRGRVLGVEGKGKSQAIKALVPLAEMLEYATQLRSLTGDRGDYTMELSHFEDVPAHIQDKLVAEAKKEEKED